MTLRLKHSASRMRRRDRISREDRLRDSSTPVVPGYRRHHRRMLWLVGRGEGCADSGDDTRQLDRRAGRAIERELQAVIARKRLRSLQMTRGRCGKRRRLDESRPPGTLAVAIHRRSRRRRANRITDTAPCQRPARRRNRYTGAPRLDAFNEFGALERGAWRTDWPTARNAADLPPAASANVELNSASRAQALATVGRIQRLDQRGVGWRALHHLEQLLGGLRHWQVRQSPPQ